MREPNGDHPGHLAGEHLLRTGHAPEHILVDKLEVRRVLHRELHGHLARVLSDTLVAVMRKGDVAWVDKVLQQKVLRIRHVPTVERVHLREPRHADERVALFNVRLQGLARRGKEGPEDVAGGLGGECLDGCADGLHARCLRHANVLTRAVELPPACTRGKGGSGMRAWSACLRRGPRRVPVVWTLQTAGGRINATLRERREAVGTRIRHHRPFPVSILPNREHAFGELHAGGAQARQARHGTDREPRAAARPPFRRGLLFGSLGGWLDGSHGPGEVPPARTATQWSAGKAMAGEESSRPRVGGKRDPAKDEDGAQHFRRVPVHRG